MRLGGVVCGLGCIVALALLVIWLAPSQAWAAFGMGDPPQYRARAWLRLSAQQPYIAYPPEDADDYESFKRTQATLITSPLILRRALETLDLASLPKAQAEAERIERLQEAVRCRQVDDSELWEVSRDWPDPKEAAAIVNAIIERYSEFVTDTSSDGRKRVLELLDVEQELRERDIVLKLEARRQLVNQLGVDAKTPVDNLVESALRDSYLRLQTQLDEIIVALAELDAADKEGAEQRDAPSLSDKRARLERTKKALSDHQAAVLERFRAIVAKKQGSTLTAKDELKLLALDEDLGRAKEVYLLIAGRSLRLSIEARAPSRIQVVEEAEVPTTPLP